jgi:hypothetical protein
MGGMQVEGVLRQGQKRWACCQPRVMQIRASAARPYEKTGQLQACCVQLKPCNQDKRYIPEGIETLNNRKIRNPNIEILNKRKFQSKKDLQSKNETCVR